MEFNTIEKISDLFQLFFPEYCLNCGLIINLHELQLCVKCLSELPVIDYCNWPHNDLEKSFYGRIDLMAGTSLFSYSRKGVVQKLIHALKYKGNQKLGEALGFWLGERMKQSGRFDHVEMVIPVPLHPKKKRQRGYNQVHSFAMALSKMLKVPCDFELLIKPGQNQSQTTKGREARNLVPNNLFQIRNSKGIEDRSFLVVDDIITTGSTIVSCCQALDEIKGARLSVACMAYTL